MEEDIDLEAKDHVGSLEIMQGCEIGITGSSPN